MKKLLLLSFIAVLFSSCSENFSNGERIGTITQFSKTGMIWKSHEGHLNVTQTGMNSSTGFDFSIDNDNEDPLVVACLDSAARDGWKVKLNYHEVKGWNWFGNRGHTDHFVTSVDILSKTMNSMFDNTQQTQQVKNNGGIHDTIYVVIDERKK